MAILYFTFFSKIIHKFTIIVSFLYLTEKHTFSQGRKTGGQER